jgi:putative Ca2+/H+ antiporter (TMEM165/GDT1 family)
MTISTPPRTHTSAMLVSMHIGIILLVFSIIFVSELPDKSMFATLFLSTRYPSTLVWLGAATAFLVHVIIAVTLGHFLTFLPHKLLESIIAAVFLLGSALVFFGKHGLEKKIDPKEFKLHSSQKTVACLRNRFQCYFHW